MDLTKTEGKNSKNQKKNIKGPSESLQKSLAPLR